MVYPKIQCNIGALSNLIKEEADFLRRETRLRYRCFHSKNTSMQKIFISFARDAAAQCIDEASAKSFCPELIKNLGIASHIFQDNLSPVHCPKGEPSIWFPGYLDGWTNPLNWVNHSPEMFSNPSNEAKFFL